MINFGKIPEKLGGMCLRQRVFKLQTKIGKGGGGHNRAIMRLFLFGWLKTYNQINIIWFFFFIFWNAVFTIHKKIALILISSMPFQMISYSAFLRKTHFVPANKVVTCWIFNKCPQLGQESRYGVWTHRVSKINTLGWQCLIYNSFQQERQSWWPPEV